MLNKHFDPKKTEAYYMCKTCGVKNCKLWGDINKPSISFKFHLACATCVAKKTKTDIESFIALEDGTLKQRTIKNFSPAIPDFKATTETYLWGTHITTNEWWDNLKTIPS